MLLCYAEMQRCEEVVRGGNRCTGTIPMHSIYTYTTSNIVQYYTLYVHTYTVIHAVYPMFGYTVPYILYVYTLLLLQYNTGCASIFGSRGPLVPVARCLYVLYMYLLYAYFVFFLPGTLRLAPAACLWSSGDPDPGKKARYI